MKKIRIVLTNDDGIRAEGLRALAERLKSVAHVTVVAPESERSGVGHAITLSVPIRVKESTFLPGIKGYAVKGTPADCVKFALKKVCAKRPPDCLISGINRGPNVGVNVLYSGTVAAAAEGTVYDVPSIAISVLDYENPNYEVAAEFLAGFLPKFMASPPPSSALLNINIPKGTPKGVRVTEHGRSGFDEDFEQRLDTRKEPYFWIYGHMTDRDAPRVVTDYRALEAGYITLTPISIVLTCPTYLRQLKKAFSKK